jgi:hypothetical protein
MANADLLWPELSYPKWRDTAATLQLWTQIVGKVRLSLTPWINHSWHVPFYVTARGLGSSPIPVNNEVVEFEFDFIGDSLTLRSSGGQQRAFALAPQSVATFYERVLALLSEIGVTTTISAIPNEVQDPIPFSQDRRHEAYDSDAARAFWRVLLQADRLFKDFRSSFIGKVSPVHFFWGSFDLAVTRFSGRPAPRHPGGVPGLPDAVTREAYSHEVSSAGFWPGNDAFPCAAFYSYAYPEPPGFRNGALPAGARFDAQLGEYILPYDAVRAARDPDTLVLEFLTRTYVAAAQAGEWNRAQLECPAGRPRRVRPIAGGSGG